MDHTDYRVLAPDSVAWHIQAALVADRAGNKAARDLALAEAQRIAQERRLAEQPAPDGLRVLCYDCRTNGERIAVLEDRLRILSDTMRRIVSEQDRQLYALEESQNRLIHFAEALADQIHAEAQGNLAAFIQVDRLHEAILVQVDKMDERLAERVAALESKITPAPAIDPWEAYWQECGGA